ncbi:MAG: hypothetical protein IKX56_04370, partial [Muribaculaceae bacterium]|nr:hypothetical protein [Muribaculaceae bacterium]
GILSLATLVEVVGEHKIALVDFLFLHGAKLSRLSVVFKQKPKKVKVLPLFGLQSYNNFAIILHCQNDKTQES